MIKIHFTLGNTLEELNVTQYHLAVKSQMRANTIYDMVANKSKSVNLATLTSVLDTLNEIAKEQGIARKIDVKDIFIYVG
ncbi:hypothetical protein IHV10_22245 [Fictibacillus sp. 5RED26]|uniref:hypothetical protein n=1 Tax=Fictibacillus sp. 5RED26 TaxID=2745876 RepID=UPI0018CE949A|nr:hypothetical protein [Fictibacillus sp. 5RED26]MBH0159094.1 hypothetical protein [Fictibacillus sp. 5RED26]